MSDDLLRQARFIVQLFRECSAIQLPHKPTEDVLTGMVSRIETLTAERDAAIASLSEAARLRGEAEGKLLAAETPGVLEGWMREAEKAEAERDALAGKLARAVSALHCIVEEDQINVLGGDETRDGHFAKIARATLAEITGTP